MLTIFCLIFTNIQTKSTDFALNTADFNDSSKILSKISSKMQKFGQSGPKNCFFSCPSPALNLRLKVFTKLDDSSCKNKIKNPTSEGVTSTQTPRRRATKSSPMSKDGSTPLIFTLTYVKYMLKVVLYPLLQISMLCALSQNYQHLIEK